jgi:hypothetical protein
MTPRRSACLAIFTATAFVSAACGSDPGRVNLFVSPDGSLIADVYRDSGGGAAGWITESVQLRRHEERFRFKDDVVFRAECHCTLRVVWKSPTELEISYPGQTSIYESESTWNNVSITLREDAAFGEPYSGVDHFGVMDSPDEQNVAVWHQDPNRGDDHWLEDCVQLIRNEYDPSIKIGENCSFVGISGDNLRMKWSTATHLNVSYPPGTKVTKADPKWNHVTITYAEDPKLQKY